MFLLWAMKRNADCPGEERRKGEKSDTGEEDP